jgi:hypothetical protein
MWVATFIAGMWVKVAAAAVLTRPKCAVCGLVQYTVGRVGKSPLRLGSIPTGYQFGNNSCYNGMSWCDKCRGQYNRQTPLRTMPIEMVPGMVMPISTHYEIVHVGRTTDPVELLKEDEKVPFQINSVQILAAVEVVSCAAATALLCAGCGCSSEEANEIKRQARNGQLVYIRPIMSFLRCRQCCARANRLRSLFVAKWTHAPSHSSKPQKTWSSHAGS